MTDRDRKPAQVPGVLVISEKEGARLEHPETGTVRHLNSSALAIWSLCDGETTIAEMAEAISEVTGLGLDEAIGEVTAVISRLKLAGMIDG